MTTADILHFRLTNQQISQPDFKTPGELVAWLGAMQAQDYSNSKWAIGLRLKNSTEDDIEQAVADKKIVRTWPMRGTLHYVSPEDVHWMLKLLTPRVVARAANIYKLAGLDKKIFLKSKKLFARILEGGKHLTRNEIYQALERVGISTADQRGLHILGNLAQEGLICFGPHKGKQPTFTLLDEWLPSVKKLHRDEALEKLTRCYFTSHGPATVQDMTWWCGLTVSDVNHGLKMVGRFLQKETINGQTYWMASQLPDVKKSKAVYLLPNYDEYLVGYKNRGLTIDSQNVKELANTGNGIFTPVIIVNNKIEGVWKRNFENNKVVIKANLFSKMSKSSKHSLSVVAKRYARFLNRFLSLSFQK